MCDSLGTHKVYLFSFLYVFVDCECLFYNSRRCELTYLQTTLNESSEVQEDAELTRRHPNAYETHKLFVLFTRACTDQETILKGITIFAILG